jgi:hypothetical protein
MSSVGDIWSTGAFSFESPLKDLLDAGDYTLEQLLAQDELLQELRGIHPQLIAYLSTPQAVASLMEYIIQPPPAETLVLPATEGAVSAEVEKQKEDHELKYIRYPFMACEIVCCELDDVINQCVDGKIGTTRHLDILCSVLTTTKVGALDDYRAGYLEKVLRVLLKKRTDTMTDYLNEHKELLLPSTLQHVYSYSIMQIAQWLLLPHRPTPSKDESKDDDDEDDLLITEENNNVTGEIKCEWSQSSQALDLLLGSLFGIDSTATEAEQERCLDLSLNTAAIMITMIQNSMLSSVPMLYLTSTPILEKLIHAATTLRPQDYFSSHESLLTSAMSVLEILILQLGGYGAVGTMSLVNEDANQQSEGGTGDKAESGAKPLISDMKNMIDLLPFLLDSMDYLLKHPSTDEWKSVTQYEVEPQPMLGKSRLRIVRVIEALVLLGDPDVDAQLVQSDCLETCLNLFWDFQWCSMLHQSVANLLVHVMEGLNARVDMQEYFLIRCNLLVRLMDSFKDATQQNLLLGAPDVAEMMMNMDNDDMHIFSVVSEDVERDVDSKALAMSEDDVGAALEGRHGVISSEVENDADNETLAASKGNDDAVFDKQQNGSFSEMEIDVANKPLTISEDFVDTALQQHRDVLEMDKDADNEPLPISEDDVDAALEGQQDDPFSHSERETDPLTSSDLKPDITESFLRETPDGPTVRGLSVPAQSFRFGYMGHVIIICQALVHACSVADQDHMDDEHTRQSDGGRSYDSVHKVAKKSSASVVSRDSNDEQGSPKVGDDTSLDSVLYKDSLFLAAMVACHPLRDRWDEFVMTTLAAETSLQSTPLGGFAAMPVVGTMFSHRPGMSENDGMDTAPLPPRGRLGELDMDDNDLDVAASMMAGMTIRQGYCGDDNSSEGQSLDSGDSEKSYNSGETNNSPSGYIFEDPLGSGLGIELGKLTKLMSDPNAKLGVAELKDEGAEFKEEGDAVKHSSSSSSSSDHSSDHSSSSDGEPKNVQDLFAGNFSYGDQPETYTSPEPADAWSDFANFDEAFTPLTGGDNPDDNFGGFNMASTASFKPGSDSAPDLDAIFENGQDSVSLLDALATESEETREQENSHVDELENTMEKNNCIEANLGDIETVPSDKIVHNVEQEAAAL